MSGLPTTRPERQLRKYNFSADFLKEHMVFGASNDKPAPSVAARSLWKLGGLTPGQLGRAVFEEINENNVFGRAAELAFYFLFALFPLIFLMMTLFGLFASHSAELQNEFLSSFADFLPATAFQLLRGVTTEITAHASQRKLTFGVVSALWCISSCVSSMICFLNAVFHVRETRSWFKARVIALVLSLVASILLLTALFMVLAGSHFVGWLGVGLRLNPLVVLVWRAIQWPTAIFFVAVDLSLRSRLERAPSLALVYAWCGIWWVYMAGGFVWIPYLPAFF